MKRINVKKQWEVIKRELFINKPKKIPYLKNIVRKRELLLFAQCFLSDYETAINNEDKLKSELAYIKTMEAYFSWGK